MKRMTLYFFLLMSISCLAQGKLPVEQIAFDFYADSLKENFTNLKVIVAREPIRSCYYWDVDCKTNMGLETLKDTSYGKLYKSPINKIKIRSHKQFKSGRFNEVFPFIFVSKPIVFNNGEKYLTAIIEHHKEFCITYLIELDKVGNVIKYCEGKKIFRTLVRA